MWLSDEEFGQLKQAVVGAYPSIDDLRDLADAMGTELDVLVALPAKLGSATGQLLRAFHGSDLIRLIDEAIKGQPTNRTLRAVGETLKERILKRKPWYMSPDPHDTCIVLNNQPFVDRIALRSLLRALSSPGTNSILIINGAKGSGKSYSVQLMSFLHRYSSGRFNFASIDAEVETSRGVELSPEYLMRGVGAEVGYDIRKIPSPKLNSKASSGMYEWLKSQTVKAQKDLWIALDGFGAEDAVPRATRDLIEIIALKGWKTNPWVRLILVDYDAKLLPPTTAAMTRIEQITPITKQHLAEFFRVLYSHRAEEFTEGGIDAIVQKVEQSVSLQSPVNLEALRRRVMEVLAESFPEVQL